GRGIGRVTAIPAYDHRDHSFAEIGIGNADHGRFEHAGQVVDDAFDFLRIHIQAAADDQVLGAADDGDVAIGRVFADIAGFEIAFGAEVLSRLFRQTPIAAKDIDALDLAVAEIVG